MKKGWLHKLVLLSSLIVYSYSAVGQDFEWTVNNLLNLNTLSHKEQVKSLKEEIEKDTTNINAWLMLGMLYENIHQVDSAVEAFSQAYALNNECEPCIQMYANTLSLQGRIGKAKDLYQSSLDLFPHNASLRSQYARLLKREALFSEAFVQYAKLLKTDSTNFYLWEQLGDCAIRLGQNIHGIEYYKTSLEHNTSNLPLAIKLINAKVKSGFLPYEIMPYADNALGVDSTYVPMIKVKGLLHYLGQDYAKSEVWFEKAMNKGDSTLFTLKYLGISLYHMGNFWSADEWLAKAYAKDSLDKNLNYYYARSLIELGDGKKAVKLMENTLDLITPSPQELAAYQGTIGDAQKKLQQYSNAVASFSRAFELNPSYLYYLFEVGECQLRQAELEAAQETFNRYIAIAEQDSTKYRSGISSARYKIKRIEKELFFNDSSTERIDTIRLQSGGYILRYSQ